MANPPIGDNIMEGVLGVCRVEFDGVAMGKTTEDTEVEIVEDIKDIIFQQDGTQPADKIPTGQAWQVSCTFGEITMSRLQTFIRGFTASGGGNSASLGRDIYRSGKDNFAKNLRLKRVDSDGVSSTNPLYWLTFYAAMPIVNSPLVYGSETQRNIQVTFYCFFDETNLAYGYAGNASSVGLAEAV